MTTLCHRVFHHHSDATWTLILASWMAIKWADPVPTHPLRYRALSLAIATAAWIAYRQADPRWGLVSVATSLTEVAYIIAAYLLDCPKARTVSTLRTMAMTCVATLPTTPVQSLITALALFPFQLRYGTPSPLLLLPRIILCLSPRYACVAALLVAFDTETNDYTFYTAAALSVVLQRGPRSGLLPLTLTLDITRVAANKLPSNIHGALVSLTQYVWFQVVLSLSPGFDQ
jgi:hypothetical protein